MLFSLPRSSNNETAVSTLSSSCSRGGALQPSPYRDRSEVSCLSNSASTRFQTRSSADSTSSCEADGQYFLKISSMFIFFRFFIVYLLGSSSVSLACGAPDADSQRRPSLSGPALLRFACGYTLARTEDGASLINWDRSRIRQR